MINLAFKRILVLVFYFLLAGVAFALQRLLALGWPGWLFAYILHGVTTCSTGALPKGNGVNMEFDPLLG
jgi:hypothetical protein